MKQEDIQAELGQRFFQLRKQNGITQLEMARRIRLSRTSITNIETGRQSLLSWRFVQMCAVLNLEPWQVLHPNWEALCDPRNPEWQKRP